MFCIIGKSSAKVWLMLCRHRFLLAEPVRFPISFGTKGVSVITRECKTSFRPQARCTSASTLGSPGRGVSLCSRDITQKTLHRSTLCGSSRRTRPRLSRTSRTRRTLGSRSRLKHISAPAPRGSFSTSCGRIRLVAWGCIRLLATGLSLHDLGSAAV